MRWLGAAMSLVMCGSGCGDLSCCNSCGRNYYLVDGDDGWAVWIGNLGEGGDECTIDDAPRSLEDGPHTLLVEVVRVDDAGATEVHRVDSRPGSHAACADGPVAGTVGDLDRAAVGDQHCLVAEVRAETLCTEKACAL